MTDSIPPILYGPLESSRAGPVRVEQPIVIGRAKSCDMCIDDLQISRCQARFFRDMEGGLLVEDLGSKNGTFINNNRSITIARLRIGDIVRMGGARFKVIAESLDEDMSKHSRMRRADSFLITEVGNIVLPEPTPRPKLFDSDYTNTFVLENPQNGAHRFATLFSLSRILQEHSDPNTALDAVLQQILSALDGDLAYVGQLDEEGTLVRRSVKSRTENDERVETFTLSQSVVDYILKQRCAVIAPDLRNDDRFADSDSIQHCNGGSILAVPIIIKSEVYGLLAVCQKLSHSAMGESDLNMLFITASILGPAMHNMDLAHQRERHLIELKAAHTQLLATQEKLIHSEKMALVGRLATGVLHEVKNNLSPLMLADFIARRYPDDEDTQDVAELVIEARERIMELVSELRYFADGQSPKLNRAPCNLADLSHRVIRFLRHDDRLNMTPIERTIADDTLTAFIDSARIRQVLINLLNNAAAAIIGKDDGQIELRIEQQDDRACILIVDNGTGIKPEIQDEIFKPFFTTKGDHGLGLGLDICHRIVQDHEGSLTFTSALGEGTTFKLSLPLSVESV